jgi:hypothetical protein
MLKNSKDLETLIHENNNSEAFYSFVTSYATIPLANENIDVLIELSSARALLNPNTLLDGSTALKTKRLDALKAYFSQNALDSAYVDLMQDVLNTDPNYYTQSDIFQTHPSLTRGGIYSQEHQNILVEFFKNRYQDGRIDAIDFDKLFIYSSDKTTKIDLNFATPQLWSLLTGCDLLRAQSISARGGTCHELACFELLDEEKESLEAFAYSFYEPIIQIKLTLRNNEMRAFISFEYDLTQKKGKNFVYQI